MFIGSISTTKSDELPSDHEYRVIVNQVLVRNSEPEVDFEQNFDNFFQLELYTIAKPIMSFNFLFHSQSQHILV